MSEFRYIDDVRAWLEPMSYERFWSEIAPYCLVLESRSVCDAQIETGMVDLEVILDGLKIMARHELSKRHKLEYRPVTPWLTLVE